MMVTTRWPYHAQDEIDAVVDVLKSGRSNYWNGEHGQAFEREFAAYTGAAHALTVTNGTTALELALHGVMADKCDRAFPTSVYIGGEWHRRHECEVICPTRTFMATASSVVTSGMKPVLADIDPITLNVTVETLEARRTSQTIAVIVVHFAGLPCDMPAIMEWANKHGVVVIEDCAHAHGALVGGQHVGTFGAVGCFSFCLGKIMSTGGEGGMVICNDAALHQRMAARRDHGRYQLSGSKDFTNFEYSVQDFGSNLRLTEMQSAIGRLQLKKLDSWNAKRNEIAHWYDTAFGSIDGVDLPARGDDGVSRVWYLYTLLVDADKRPGLLDRINARGIPARLNGCPNLYGEPVWRGATLPCQQADAVGKRTLGLPIYPTITAAEATEIIGVTAEELKRG